MINIDNVYSKDGLFVSRQIKSEYNVEKVSIDYDGKKVISKIEEKQKLSGWDKVKIGCLIAVAIIVYLMEDFADDFSRV